MRDGGGWGWRGAWAMDGPIRAQRAEASPDREQHDRHCRQDGHRGHRLSCRPVQGKIVFQVIWLDPMTPKIGFQFVGQVAANGKAKVLVSLLQAIVLVNDDVGEWRILDRVGFIRIRRIRIGDRFKDRAHSTDFGVGRVSVGHADGLVIRCRAAIGHK